MNNSLRIIFFCAENLNSIQRENTCNPRMDATQGWQRFVMIYLFIYLFFNVFFNSLYPNLKMHTYTNAFQ